MPPLSPIANARRPSRPNEKKHKALAAASLHTSHGQLFSRDLEGAGPNAKDASTIHCLALRPTVWTVHAAQTSALSPRGRGRVEAKAASRAGTRPWRHAPAPRTVPRHTHLAHMTLRRLPKPAKTSRGAVRLALTHRPTEPSRQSSAVHSPGLLGPAIPACRRTHTPCSCALRHTCARRLCGDPSDPRSASTETRSCGHQHLRSARREDAWYLQS